MPMTDEEIRYRIEQIARAQKDTDQATERLQSRITDLEDKVRTLERHLRQIER